jgi:betaine-aldehyde dehydrogenase
VITVPHPYLNQDFTFTIGGKGVGAVSRRTAPVINPATEEVLVEIPDGDKDDVELAVVAAEQARAEWQALGWNGRASAIRDLAAALEEDLERFAVLDALDGGNPIKAMRLDARAAIDSLYFFAGLAGEAKGSSLPATPGTVIFTLREPYGVVGRIVAYNHPFMFAVSKTVAALVAGNTVVLKPSDHTALSALVLGRVAAEVLPPGVLNVVAGPAEVGAALVGHPRVPRVAFTGSVGVARRILSATAAGIKPVTLELGGKNPMIVCDDVDVARTARASIAGMNFARSQGQSCQSNSRVFVHDSIYDEFIGIAAEHLGTLRVGDPMSEDTDIGPVSFEGHRDNVRRYIGIGQEEGARVITGGLDAPVPDRGYFVAPTIFADVTPDMVIAQEEIFGPVMSVLRWSDEAQVIRDANAVDYGLTASVWTQDVSRAYRMATSVEAGYVWINKVGPRPYGAPFGGYKHSGMGKESNVEEIVSFTREKVIDHSF